MLKQEQQIYFEDLSAWSGYQRQDALEQLADCYEAVLFPALLKRLSDYVPINRELAAQHLMRWSERADFADLCVQYFEDVVAIQQRIRIVSTVEDILLHNIADHIAAVKTVFLKEQGKRPRLFLRYIQRYQWLDQATLLKWCEQAKDQRVRGYWLNDLIEQNDLDALKQALYSTSFRNIKMKLLPILYEKNALSIDEYLALLQQPSLSIMAFAIFALKKQNFDFIDYFNAQVFAHLTVEQQRLRLYQWVLLTLPKATFKQDLMQLTQQSLQFSVLIFARNQSYLSALEYLKCYVDFGGQLDLDTLQKLNQKFPQKLNVQDLAWVCHTLCPQFSFLDLMYLVTDYGYWDQFLWLMMHESHLQTDEDKRYFLEKFIQYIQQAKYQYYAPSWQQAEKQNLLTCLDRYQAQIIQHAVLQEACHLKQILSK